jgi:hypothetical protein
MSSSRSKKNSAATAAAGPASTRAPSPTADPADREVADREDDGEEQAQEDIQIDEELSDDSSESKDREIANLRAQLERTQAALRLHKEIENLASAPPARRAAIAKKLLERYPSLRELEPYWPIALKKLLPPREGAAKPTSLELLMEGGGDRTYTKLHHDKKDSQKRDYAALLSLYTWIKTYADAIFAELADEYRTAPDRLEARFGKLFNGLNDALEMGAERISFIQVKTFPEDFDEAFQHVVQVSINRDRVQDQLTSTKIASLHDVFSDSLQDKVITHSIKQALSSRLKFSSDKPSSSTAPTGSKSDKKRPARKKPEERPAPQA